MGDARTVTEQQLADARVEVRAFLDDQRLRGGYRPRPDAWLTGWSPEFSRELGRRGWLGLTIPRAYGGHESSALVRYVVIEELLAAGAPVAAHWFADRQIAPSLLAYGSEEQRQRYLPGIVRGEQYFALGLSEADAGSDLAALRTRATRVHGGWRLDGAKLWSSGAHRAHAIVVLARSTPREDVERPQQGLSQFIVELPAPGVQVNPIRLLTGEHHFNEVVFDGAVVPDANVLGNVDDGWRQVTAELAHERSGPERYLSTFPLLQALVARLHAKPQPDLVRDVGRLSARAWTLRQLSLGVARLLDEGEVPEVEAAMVKDLGTRFEQDVATTLLEAAVDRDGADDEVSRMLADAVLHSPGYPIRGGASEILRGVVARSMGLR